MFAKDQNKFFLKGGLMSEVRELSRARNAKRVCTFEIRVHQDSLKINQFSAILEARYSRGSL